MAEPDAQVQSADPESKQKDMCLVTFDFTKKASYLRRTQYGYFQTPNEVEIGWTVDKHHARLEKMHFAESSIGTKHRFAKNQRLLFIQQEFEPFWQVVPVFRRSWSNRTIEQNCSERMQKTSVTFRRDFRQGLAVGLEDGQDAPNLFKHSFLCNPQNFVYLKLSSKFRQNKVAELHSSAALVENAVGEDH